jgi:hypothetical protein
MPETRLKETQPPMSGYFFVVCEPKTLNLTKKGALLPTYLVVLQHSLLFLSIWGIWMLSEVAVCKFG